MAGAWRALVLVVGLAVVACAAHRQTSYEKIVAQAVQFFNQGRLGQSLFRLLEAIPPPRLNSTSTIPLNFRIKETVCLSTLRRRLQECAFKEGGEERNCSGSFTGLQHFHILMLECPRDSGLQQEAPRVRRSAESPEVIPTNIDSSQLPPPIRDLYEKAKFDIIANILRNF
ncbi:15 kDa protein B-like [Tamandua tetradactyla]|uniref:15 kDa protein B-like n=1 Tax=Tamandua tetradactyla TaxID=48850 RepID=UPI004053D016